jgi:hypothetical protein
LILSGAFLGLCCMVRSPMGTCSSSWVFFSKWRLKPRLLHHDDVHGLLLNSYEYKVLEHLKHRPRLIQESTSKRNKAKKDYASM